MERYHYFSSSCRQFGFNCKSLSELKGDENEADGALATVLGVLKSIHEKFFDPVRNFVLLIIVACFIYLIVLNDLLSCNFLVGTWR